MSRFARPLVAAILGAALVSALPGPCDCRMHAAPRSSNGHECCAPATGVSAVADCCRTAPAQSAEAVTTGATVATTPGPLAVVVTLQAHEAPRLPASPVAPAHSPPPAILRL